MTYIDGFVTPVPRAARAAYETHVAQAAPIFADLGATRLVECWGDDVPPGQHPTANVTIAKATKRAGARRWPRCRGMAAVYRR